ncbi:MAG: hypothetical protein CMI55_03100 [Parcubacteria group bacterium]|jgi:hypothetical protein|nr:hypothetical protein [Parcubacteria group bacterium]|tara:strand:+ start:197 stop:811 length:615 start_codon:yes stop_codon:yes gene_type:complete
MRQKILNQKTKSLLQEISPKEFLSDFYLAGGTALALQLNHRKSIDLDWFNQKDFNTEKLKRELNQLGKVIIESEEKNSLNLILSGVKLSFLNYPYKLLFPLIDWQKIKLADKRDIACMKLNAISSRGSKKDFIDLFFILKEYPLIELLKLFDQKYQNIKYNKMHIFKSLTYFIEADNEPLPIMLKDINWEEIKKHLQEITKRRL